jgi:hypothetical protein
MTMRLVVLVALVACGPAVPPEPANPKPRDVRADGLEKLRSRDPSVLRQLMGEALIDSGLVFVDPECSTAFNAPRDVKAGDLDAFAQCLAKLELQPSAREHWRSDTAVLEYGAGFEVEARLEDDHGVARLSRIGFESLVPMVTPAHLAALRVETNDKVTLPPVLEPNALAWVGLCVNATGSIDETRLLEVTSPLAGATFEAIVKQWRFKPLVVADQPSPFCARLRLARQNVQEPEIVPPVVPRSRSGATPIVLAPTVLEQRRIRGTKLVVPNDTESSAMDRARVSRVDGIFRLCIDETGATESVVALRSTGLPTYDRDIILAMRKWAFQPFVVAGRAVPVCTAVTFVYTQRGPVQIRR